MCFAAWLSSASAPASQPTLLFMPFASRCSQVYSSFASLWKRHFENSRYLKYLKKQNRILQQGQEGLRVAVLQHRGPRGGLSSNVTLDSVIHEVLEYISRIVRAWLRVLASNRDRNEYVLRYFKDAEEED